MSAEEFNTEGNIFIDGILELPAAKQLLQHFSALEALTKCDDEFRESASEETSNWKRLFFWSINNQLLPLGLETPLPKCIAFCNLSGNRFLFYSKTFALAKLICETPQKTQERICLGVGDVIKAAKTLNASIVVFFSLPFQLGLHRANWEIRTVRKIQGVWVDGECAFSLHDCTSRKAQDTCSAEHLQDDCLHEMCIQFQKMCTPTNLDIDCVSKRNELSFSQQNAMIEMLKTDRKRLIKVHNNDIAKQQAENAKQLLEAGDLHLSLQERYQKEADDIGKTTQRAMAMMNKQITSTQNECKALTAKNAKQELELCLKLEACQKKLKMTESRLHTKTMEHNKRTTEECKSVKQAKQEHDKVVHELQTKLSACEMLTQEHKKIASIASAACRNEEESGMKAKQQIALLIQQTETNAENFQKQISILKLKSTSTSTESTQTSSPPLPSLPPLPPLVQPPDVESRLKMIETALTRAEPETAVSQNQQIQANCVIVDPLIEQSINAIYVALQNVTFAARSANTNACVANVAQSKLNCLGYF